MKIWDVIAAQNPQAFLLIGDNVYGDTRATNSADIPTLTASYRALSSRVEFDRFGENLRSSLEQQRGGQVATRSL